MLTARMFLLSGSFICPETHSRFTAIQWEHVGGLSHNQRIQTFRCQHQLVFVCHGLDLWRWILKCVDECFRVYVNPCFFTDGASSLYDGTPLVGQSVARVWRSWHFILFSTLGNGLYSRERQSFLCPSTTALDLLASLKVRKL